MRKDAVWLVSGYTILLLAMGALRLISSQNNSLAHLSLYATIGYIAGTIFFSILFIKKGLPLDRFGFGGGLDVSKIFIAIAAIVVLQISAYFLEPLWEQLLGSGRNLERFSELGEGSSSYLIKILFTSWTFAAFGEELAYRIILMRGLSFAFGDTSRAKITALLLQALIFGLAHSYQGPTGIASSAFSGLIFGAVTLKSRWSIWPSAIAHGLNNTIGILSLYSF